VAGIAAAAAAGLLVLTLTLPHIGQSTDSGGEARPADAGAGAEQAPQALAAQGIEIQRMNYDNESLAALSGSFARDSSTSGAAATASGPLGTLAGVPGSQRQTDDALACIRTSAPDATGTLTRLIRARFDGAPAYLAVFLEGPGAGQPADAANVWVLATGDCTILSYSHAKL
jgi:hypothetical protein